MKSVQTYQNAPVILFVWKDESQPHQISCRELVGYVSAIESSASEVRRGRLRGGEHRCGLSWLLSSGVEGVTIGQLHNQPIEKSERSEILSVSDLQNSE